MKIIELFVFWYPITMGMLWVVGSIIYYLRLERRDPLPLTVTPFVSVLVPAYNEGSNIVTTVEMLNELNYPNYEIIIINDGSSDDSPYIEEELAIKYDKVRFVNLEENCGKANALYLGLMAAKGEYLVCVDGDSYLDKDCLRYMIPHFVNANNGERVGAVTGNPRVRNRSSLLAKIQICEYASIISLIKRCQRIWGKVMTVSGVVVAYRKQALMDCGLWDRDMITEDIGVTWKLEKNFWDVRYEPNAICWMLVPETIKGLFKQRRRWAQGGQEVLFRHANIFKSWRRRRLYPVYAEQILSLIWVLAWLLLTLTELIRLCYDADTYMTYFWKTQFISVICLFQFTVALWLERKYDHKIMRNMIVAAWYPAVYWIISGLVALTAIPLTIKSRNNKLATWSSPDRGIGTTDGSSEDANDTVGESSVHKIVDITPEMAEEIREKRRQAESVSSAENVTDGADDANVADGQVNADGSESAAVNIIQVKQKRWKKVIEVIFTAIMWIYVLIYVAYFIYGDVDIHIGDIPIKIWIYNKDVVTESIHLFKIVGIIVLVEILVMIFWKEYNRRKFGVLRRRKFKPDVSMEQLVEMFKVPEEVIVKLQTNVVTTLHNNLFSPDFKPKGIKK